MKKKQEPIEVKDEISLKKALDKILNPFLKQFDGTILKFIIEDTCDNYFRPSIELSIYNLKAGHYLLEDYFSRTVLHPMFKLMNAAIIHDITITYDEFDKDYFIHVLIELSPS